MVRFSERKGYKPIKVDIQKDSMDEELRIGLWNAFDVTMVPRITSADDETLEGFRDSDYGHLFEKLWMDHFKWKIGSLGFSWTKAKGDIEEWFFDADWYEIYDFLEFFAQNTPEGKDELIKCCNDALERERSAYRFIGDQIAEITSKEEIEAIEDALTGGEKLSGVTEHLQAALKLLADRKNYDYRNSIKESISAVESLFQILIGKKWTLGKALKHLPSDLKLHPALVEAWSSLYGYTSDREGIRHALREKSDLTFADAKYMLVSCSAFINYILVLSSYAESIKTGK